MTIALVLVLLWGAAVYRVALSALQPLTIWRTALTLAITMAALSITLWALRGPLDQILGVPNLTNLLYHVTTLVGLVGVLIYDESLRHDVLPRRLFVLHVGAGAVAATSMSLAWTVAPLHDRSHHDLTPLTGHPSIAVYTTVFYVFLIWTLGRKAVLCFTQGLRREDPARTVSLILNGSACALGTVIGSLWTTAALLRLGRDVDPTPMSRVGDALLPVALTLLGIGILTMFAMPWLLDVVHSYRRIRALRPEWVALTALYPEVRLRPARVFGLRTWVETRERRMAIEIEDACRLRRLQPDPAAAEVAAAGLDRSKGRR